MCNVKLCSCCQQSKPFGEFYKSAAREHLDGVGSYCKSCACEKARKHAKTIKAKETKRAYVTQNPGLYRDSAKRYYKNNTEKKRQYVANNPQIYRDSASRWLKRNYPLNKSKYRARSKEYALKKLKATPLWANKFFIEQAYELAAIRNKVTGIEWEVDHIVPIRGKTVCGLHVESNLRVIPMIANRQKHNKLLNGPINMIGI